MYSAVVVAFVAVNFASDEVIVGNSRIKTDGLVDVADRLVMLAVCSVGDATISVGNGIVGSETDGLRVVALAPIIVLALIIDLFTGIFGVWYLVFGIARWLVT